MANMDAPHVYDKAKYHSESIELAGLPDGQEFVHTGFYLAWLVSRGLLSPEFLAEFGGEEVLQVQSRDLTGPQLFMRWDGALVDDMLNDEGNAFSMDYFDFDRGSFVDDYSRVFGVGGGDDFFGVEDTWENFDKIKDCIDKAFDEWRSKRASKPRPLWRRFLNK